MYLAAQSQVFWHYLWLCVWPIALSIDYRWQPFESVLSATPWILATSTVLGFGVLRYRKREIDGWLILALFLLLAPTSTLIPITDLAVDHRMYLGLAPVIGLGLIMVKKIESLVLKSFTPSPGWRVAILCAVLSALFLRTYTRAHDWSSGFNLWLATAKLTPSNPRAFQNLTGAAREEGREGELIAVLGELQFQAKARGEASPAVASRLGEEYLKVGSAQQAEPLLREAVAGLDPDGTIDERQEHAAARINLALVHLQRRELNEAEGHLRAAVSADPKAAYGHAMLGDLMMQRSNYSQASEHFQRALAIVPDWAQVESDLAQAKAAGKN
jgi:predicted negative regulator of RcsB-dependent stress response